MTHRDQPLERQVLAAMLTEDAMPSGLHSGCFIGDERILYEAMKGQYDRMGGFDKEMLAREHPVVFEAVAEAAYQSTGSDIAVDELRKQWKHRELEELGRYLMIGGDEPDTILQTVGDRVNEIQCAGERREYDFQATLSSVYGNIEKGMLKGSEIVGFPTGIPDLDRKISGIERGKLYVLGGLKKTGKSRFMVSASIHLARAGAGVCIDSLEMSAEQLVGLAVSNLSHVDSKLLGTKLEQAQYDRMLQASSDVSVLDWLICREKTIDGLRAYLTYKKKTRNIDVVFVDFIQRMNNDRYRSDRVREVEYISKCLADISRELDVAVVVLSQLSKDAERMVGDRIPDMSCLKESQGIAENADVIMILHNQDRQNQNTEEEYTPASMLMLIEQRYNVSGKVISLSGDMRYSDFRGVAF